MPTWDLLLLLQVLGAPLCVAFVITLTHVPLGFAVLRSGIVFIDLAVAQACGVGFLLAYLLHIENYFLQQLMTLSFGLLTALLFYQFSKRFEKYQEALIGSTYIFYSAFSVFLLSQDPHGHNHFSQILSGELLFVTWSKLLTHLPFYALVLSVWIWKKPREGTKQTNFLFYVIFTIAITSSVQLIGVYLVFTSLIIPPLVALLLKRGIPYAYLISFIGIITGIFTSFVLDTPSGATIIVTMVVVGFIFYVFQNLIIKKVKALL